MCVCVADSSKVSTLNVMTVHLTKTELDKTIVTEYCQVFHDQRVDFDGFNGTEIRCDKPDILDSMYYL